MQLHPHLVKFRHCLEHRLSLRAAGARAGVGDEPLDAGELGVGHAGLSPVLFLYDFSFPAILCSFFSFLPLALSSCLLCGFWYEENAFWAFSETALTSQLLLPDLVSA